MHLHCQHWPSAARRASLALVASFAALSCGAGQNQVESPRGTPHEPEPAKLRVAAPSGAEVHVDGTFVGVAPLAEPVVAEPGRHFVAVTLNGFDAHGQEVQLRAGQTTDLPVDLTVTDQRVAAWVLIGVGATALAGGIALGVVSVVEHRDAKAMFDRGGDDGLDGEDLDAYRDTIQARDDHRVASGVAAGAGLGLFLVGGALYALDSPAAVVAGPDSGGVLVNFRF